MLDYFILNQTVSAYTVTFSTISAFLVYAGKSGAILELYLRTG